MCDLKIKKKKFFLNAEHAKLEKPLVTVWQKR